ncbi:MAG: ABC transporter permease [Acidobacteriota bacterium]
MANLKLAVRTLVKTPFVTIVAVVSLALGIGANVAIFSLFDRMLLRPLPVMEPDRLVNLSAPGPKPGSQSCNQSGPCDAVFSYPMYGDLSRVQSVFAGIAAHRQFGANLAFRGETFSGDGSFVSGNYFGVLGLQPALGRLIDPGDTKAPGGEPVVVLSYEYWQSRFGRRPDVTGQALVVNGQSLTIAGVAPRGFTGTTLGGRPHVFVPITMRGVLQSRYAEVFEERRNYWVYLFARLKPGVSVEQARGAVQPQYRAVLNDVEAALQTGMSDETMARFRAKEIGLAEGRIGQSNVHREARVPLLLLLAVTGVVLVIACANIANLLLARAATRIGEIAVRMAIGAGRWQIVAQLLTESVVLAACGGVLGLLVARATLGLIYSLMPAEAAATIPVELDSTAMLFTAAISLATGIVFGLFPALHTSRPDLGAALKGQSGQSTGSRSAGRFRTVLATAQIALSMTLLAASGLFIKSLVNVSRVDLGLEVDNVVTFGVSPELNGYTPERSMALFERIEDELAALPGVTGVSCGLVPLLSGSNWGNSVVVEGFDAGPDTDTGSRYNEVGPGYFTTLGVALLSGREFTRADAAGAPKVAIVNEQFTKKFNLGRAAVGKRMSTGRRDASTPLDIEIVGVVPDMKYSEVKDPVPPQFFVPYRQDEETGFMTFYVRSALPPEQVLAAVPKIMARLDPNLPVEELRTMPEQVRENVFLDRLITILSTAFAALATLLAAIGLYGVLAYTVSLRTREIGLRMALGAGPAQVRQLVLHRVLWMTLAGAAVGVAAAAGLGTAAESLLFEIAGYDPLVLAGAALALSVVALGAGYIPARRASLIDPMGAIRYE